MAIDVRATWRLSGAAVGTATIVVGLLALSGCSSDSPSGGRQPVSALTDSILFADQPCGLAVRGDAHRLYVSHSSSREGIGGVNVIDTETGAIIANIPVGTWPCDLAFDESTNSLLVVNYEDGTVTVIDGESNRAVDLIAVGSKPQKIVIDEATHMAYVNNYGDDTVSVIDTRTWTVVTTVATSGAPLGMVLDPESHLVYVACDDGWDISVIDPDSWSVTSIPLDTVPVHVAFDANTQTAYISSAGGKLLVLDIQTNTVTDTISFAREEGIYHGGEVVLDPTAHVAYVLQSAFSSESGRSGGVSVIDTGTHAVLGEIELTGGPLHIELDPVTGTVYVVVVEDDGTGFVGILTAG